MSRLFLIGVALLWPSVTMAQLAPLTGTTIRSTNGTNSSLCVGCPIASAVPEIDSGMQVHGITMRDATPTVTTNKIYNIGGALFFNAGELATLNAANHTFTGFGTHAFTAGGTGGNVLGIRNTTAGTGNFAEMRVGTNTDEQAAILRANSSTFTSSGVNYANGGTLQVPLAGGLGLAATNASGSIFFYAGGTGEDVRIHASGGVSIGDTTDPSGTNLRVAGTVLVVGVATSSAFKTSTALITAIDGGATPAFTANMAGATGGPVTAAQNGWVKLQDSAGATIWVPVWK